MQPNILCVLCNDGKDETIDHLFFVCCFGKRCWNKLRINWEDDLDIVQSRTVGMPFFMEIFLIAALEIWKLRNILNFDGIQATFDRWLHNFKEEALLQCNRLDDSSDRLLVCVWLDTL